MQTQNHMLPSDAIEQIRNRTFRIETSWGSNPPQFGTGFMVAKYEESKQIFVATAKHILKFPSDAQVRWCVRSLAEDGTTLGECTFTVDERDQDARPYRSYKLADVAFCVLPPQGIPSTGKLVDDDVAPLPVIGANHRLLPGTRVAWAGFAATVEAKFKQPHLCYFEGVISAFHAEGSRGYYIVDGHNARGVSGGPVWHWSEDRNGGIEIVGIVHGYGLNQSDMPGFCVVEPINPVVGFIGSEYCKSK